MNKNSFMVIHSTGNRAQRENLVKYYKSRKGVNVKFADEVQFEHTDVASLEYASNLCPTGLIMYAQIFHVELNPARQFNKNLEIFKELVGDVDIVINPEKVPKGILTLVHDIADLEHASTLNEKELELYARQFDIELDRRETMKHMMQDFEAELFLKDNPIDAQFHGNITDIPDANTTLLEEGEAVVNTESKSIDELIKDKDSEPDGEKMLDKTELKTKVITHKDTNDVPSDLICPHCGAKARSEKSYINNHGKACSRFLETK